MTSAVASLPSVETLQTRMEHQRVALQAWAVQSLPRVLSRGYRQALASGDPKEIRQWVDTLARLGGVAAEKTLDARGSLSVFQFNFATGQVQATPMPAVEVPAREVTEDGQPVTLDPGEPLDLVRSAEFFGVAEPPLTVMQGLRPEDIASIDEIIQAA